MQKVVITLAVFLTLAACQSDGPKSAPATSARQQALALGGDDAPYSTIIPVDSANKMIGSYLAGINSAVNTDALKSLSFDADSMRAYLADSSIKTIKFCLAHSMDYADEHYGSRPDSNSHVVTLIIAGVNTDGDYVLKNSGVYENCFPCPNRCLRGAAGDDLIQQ